MRPLRAASGGALEFRILVAQNYQFRRSLSDRRPIIASGLRLQNRFDDAEEEA
jgi:hypothetical protein